MMRKNRIIRLFSIFMAIFYIAFNSAVSITSALSNEQKALFTKNILYYDLACSGVEAEEAGQSTDIKKVYMVGDSITLGAKDSFDLEKKFKDKGVDAYITASGGASITGAGTTGSKRSGIESIKEDKTKVADADSIVVALGTNHVPEGFGEAIKSMVETIKDVNKNAKILWVKTHTDAPGNDAANLRAADKKNATIERQSEQLNFETIDIKGKGITLTSDGIHPDSSERGLGRWGDVVVGAVAKSKTNDSSLGELRQLDLAAVANVNNLHSAAVRELGSNNSASFKANDAPKSVASTIKLIIADAFLDSNPDLNKKITIKGEHLYGGGGPQGTPWDPKAGQTFTLKQSLINTLEKSSNVQANVLIDEAGGPEKITRSAKKLGYNSTDITSYFKFNGNSNNPRKSTAGDLTNAMNKIFSSKDEKYKVAQEALRESSYKFGLDSVANKWGGNSDFTGNVGLFTSGDKKYIITVLMEEKWQDEVLPEFPGTRGTKPSDSVGKIKEATEKIIKDLKGKTKEARQGCACEASGVELEGKNDAIKVYNYLISETDLSPAQASGIIGSLMRETGGDGYDFEPERTGVRMCANGSDCYGIAQWGGERVPALKAWARSKNKDHTELSTQAEFIVHELKTVPANGLSLLKGVSGEDEAAVRKASRIFDENFERSVQSAEDDTKRDNNAARFFKEFVKGGGLTGNTPDSNGNCGNEGSGTSSGRFGWPDDGRKDEVVSCFGARASPGGIGSTNHQGLDIGSAQGQKVVAADGGKVVGAGGDTNNTVTLDHGNGFKTKYLHNSSIDVKTGQKVEKGDVIAKVGAVGQATGAHIHFEVHEKDKPVNPREHLPKDGRAYTGSNC